MAAGTSPQHLDGFYSREGDRDFSYRWTGPIGSAVIPNRGNESFDFAMAIDAPRPEGESQPQVVITVNGDETARFTAQPGIREYAFRFTPRDLKPNDFQLNIQSDTFSPPGDSRKLGVLVSSLELKPVAISSLQIAGLMLLRVLAGLALVVFAYLLLCEAALAPLGAAFAAFTVGAKPQPASGTRL